MKNTKGFTLVELLVVIAIIGILSSVAVVNLNSAREKGRQAAVQGLFSQLLVGAIICIDDGENLMENDSDVCDNTGAPSAGKLICSNATAMWPDLTDYSGWNYGNCDSDTTNGTFEFLANDGGGRTVRCTQEGCGSTP